MSNCLFIFIPQNVKLKDLGSQDVQCHTLEINDHRENKLRVLAYTFFIIWRGATISIYCIFGIRRPTRSKFKTHPTY